MGTAEEVSVEVEIGTEETLIRVVGTRNAALVVDSASGEAVYLPPEEFDEPPETGRSVQSPYESESPEQSPYEGVSPVDSPYETAGEGGRSAASDAEGHDSGAPSVGVETTSEGFRVRHPEPVTDVRFVR